MPEPQSFKNHTRRDPLYIFTLLVFLANFIATLVISILIALSHDSHHLGYHVWLMVVSSALIAVVVNMRMKDLRVQDRLIRLEEKLRYAAVLQPADHAAAARLSLRQIVALRFASDAELPGLIKRALAENLTGKQIKESITNWRIDDLRV